MSGAVHPLLRLFSLAFWSGIAVTSLLLYPVALLIWAVTAPFDRRLRALHQFTCLWASLYTWLNPLWRVRVEGRERIDPHATYVMIANHLSFVDILVLFRIFAHFKWVSKEEMFRLPCIGWNMTLNRYVRLQRGNRDSVVRMMGACERHLAEGSSVMIFPEGTRSPDGCLKAFKPGAFQLAQQARLPILPIVIEGTADALPKHGFILRGRRAIRIRILEPIPYATFADRPLEVVVRAVHGLYAHELGEPQAETPVSATATAS